MERAFRVGPYVMLACHDNCQVPGRMTDIHRRRLSE